MRHRILITPEVHVPSEHVLILPMQTYMYPLQFMCLFMYYLIESTPNFTCLLSFLVITVNMDGCSLVEFQGSFVVLCKAAQHPDWVQTMDFEMEISHDNGPGIQFTYWQEICGWLSNFHWTTL